MLPTPSALELVNWAFGVCSELLDAVGAEDVVFARQETSTHQRHAALFAVEAVVVPLPLLKRDVLAASET